MVRSKSKSKRKPEFFRCVDRIRNEPKRFDISFAEIEHALDSVGHCEAVCVHEFTDNDGELRGVNLKLNVNCKAPVTQGWRISLKLHGTRIDGVDHEGKYDLPDGSKAYGWHRHLWNADDLEGDNLKDPLDAFDADLLSRAEFFRRSCAVMGISFSDENGNGFLRFD